MLFIESFQPGLAARAAGYAEVYPNAIFGVAPRENEVLIF